MKAADDSYWAWNKIYEDMCDLNALFRRVKWRSVLLPWISPQLRHKMNQRYKLYLKAKKKAEDEFLWSNYREIRNEITKEVRIAKSNYYNSLFEEVERTRTYCKLIKKETD